MTTRTSNALSIAMFGLLSLVFVQFAPFTGDTVGAVDVTTRRTTPHLEDAPVFQSAEVPLQTDQTDGIALAATFWRGIQHGTLRMWEPNLGTGVPLGGVVYTRVWSPFYWVGAVVPAPVLSSWAVWLALWTAQAGAWLLARRLGIGRLGAAFAGVAYGFSGPVTALLLRINEASLAPWVLVAVHAAVSGSPRERRWSVPGLAAAVALTWLGGFPAGTVFVLYAAGAVAVVVAIRDSRGAVGPAAGSVARALAGVLLGTALVAPVLLPSYGFLADSESLERTFESDNAAGLEMFGTAVSGRLLGTYQGKDWWWPDPGYSNPVSASATLGAVTLLLLTLGVFSRSIRSDARTTRTIGRVYFPVGVVVLVGTYLGGPVLAALQVLPFLGNNQFGRSRFLLALVVALAAGCVLDGVARRLGKGPDVGKGRAGFDPWFRAGSAIVVAMALTGAGLAARRAWALDWQVPPDPATAALGPYRLDRLLDGLLVPGIVLLLAMASLLVAWRVRYRRGTAVVVGMLVVLCLAVELQWGAWGFTPVISTEEGFYPSHESYDVMQPAVSDGLWRFAGTSLNVIRPNSAAWLRMADVRVSNPSSERYRELMRAIDPDVFERARLRTWFTADLDPSSEGLDRASVRYLVAPGEAGVLEAIDGETVRWSEGPSLSVERGATPVRGLRFVLDRARCGQGFLTVRSGPEIVGRRPLWQLEDAPFDVAVEDVDGPEVLTVEVEGCDVGFAGDVTVLRAAPDTQLVSLWADDAVVYERTQARPRVEVATAVTVVDDPAARLAALTDGRDLDVVVLEGVDGPPSSAGGSATIVGESGDKIRIRVETGGAGYLVVRDAHGPGWAATVDGSPQEMLHADHAFRAVRVPAGGSVVEMTYLPWGRRLGIALAVAALAVLMGDAFWSIRTDRRVSGTPPGDGPAVQATGGDG